MSQARRWSEKWFHRALWVVAVVFAWFLAGLGSAIVGDLPKVENVPQLEQFMDSAAAQPLKKNLDARQEQLDDLAQQREQLNLLHRASQANVASARDSFSQWVATRRATQLADQDPDLIRRTRELDTLRQIERQALAKIEAVDQKRLQAEQASAQDRTALARLSQAAQQRLDSALREQELRVFGYRLALTLPLLVVAGWLLARHRRSTWWPFVWGFTFFALFAFFVELVPYLPSYGGYVRYGVGVIVTVLVGRQAIVALQRYLERQRLAESLPDADRRQELSYDTALARLAKNVCPGCERPVDLAQPGLDFCPHCGMGLHTACPACEQRISAFSHYCHKCGCKAASTNAPTD